MLIADDAWLDASPRPRDSRDVRAAIGRPRLRWLALWFPLQLPRVSSYRTSLALAGQTSLSARGSRKGSGRGQQGQRGQGDGASKTIRLTMLPSVDRLPTFGPGHVCAVCAGQCSPPSSSRPAPRAVH